MSNRSQFPKGAKHPTNAGANPGIQQFIERVGEAAEKVKAKREAEQTGEPVVPPQPVGALPLPVSQVVFEDRFEWVWEPVAEEVHVYAVMERTVDGENGGWSTRLNCVDPSMQLTPDEAKVVGEALLSAWQYQYVWKDNFADLFVSNTLEVKPLWSDKYKEAAFKPAKKTARKNPPPLRTVEQAEEKPDET